MVNVSEHTDLGKTKMIERHKRCIRVQEVYGSRYLILQLLISLNETALI